MAGCGANGCGASGMIVVQGAVAAGIIGGIGLQTGMRFLGLGLYSRLTMELALIGSGVHSLTFPCAGFMGGPPEISRPAGRVVPESDVGSTKQMCSRWVYIPQH